MAEYLQEHKNCSSWDFAADLAFAKKFCDRDVVKLIEDVMCPVNAGCPAVHVWMLGWKQPVTEKRLKALRELCNKGFAEAYWMGLGEGSRNIFGRTRVRYYELVNMP
ncbi:hypothetical protein [Photobacterium damselae]|uniref:hypothetical protein n=1 Tax=Photobacterium damselae TaxID=38293 RepID=UPI001F487DD5|nr:hypothetical protein [Photobacterium damselae]UKA04918.1 hypothetical protein IHC89_21990 [Photobacterium damselae subsp. damselae]